MRLSRELPLAAGLLLVGLALFLGGATADGSLMWLGGGALLAILATLATQGPPARVRTLLPLAALALWCGLSIEWSTEPDRSWAYADRTLVYLLFALLGLWLAPRTRALALGLAALFACVGVWALVGKVVPALALAFSYSPDARLNAPLGLWNQLALVGDFALPLALWLSRRRPVAATLLAYVWLVALVLTVSRGGIAVALVVVAAWFALSDERAAGAATLLAAALPAAAVAGGAFALPAVTGGAEPGRVGWQRLVFAAAVLLGAAATAALARAPRPRLTPALRRAALAAAGLVVLVVLATAALKASSAWHQFTSSSELSNGAGRFTSAGSNFRWVWWQRAWKAFTLHPLEGTGAGTFELTDLLYRSSSLDTATEPHDLPLQFLSETGIPGALLFLLALGVPLAAAGRRRDHELALALLLPAYVLHSLVDIDWDFVAVSAPALLAAGALAGRPQTARRVSPPASLLAAAGALVLFACLLLPWLANRWENEAGQDINPARALATAREAHRADPLLLAPLVTEAQNEPLDPAGNVAALALLRQATRMQPQNPYAWLQLGQFALGLGPQGSIGCPRLAFPALQAFTNLDDHPDPQSEGAVAEKDRALAYVNSDRRDPAYCAPYESGAA